MPEIRYVEGLLGTTLAATGASPAAAVATANDAGGARALQHRLGRAIMTLRYGVLGMATLVAPVSTADAPPTAPVDDANMSVDSRPDDAEADAYATPPTAPTHAQPKD